MILLLYVHVELCMHTHGMICIFDHDKDLTTTGGEYAAERRVLLRFLSQQSVM